MHIFNLMYCLALFLEWSDLYIWHINGWRVYLYDASWSFAP